MITVAFAFAMLPLVAQEEVDTTFVFRFVPGRDMFYVPWGGNGVELTRLESCVEQFRERILSGEIPVHVDGYCRSAKSVAANLAMAKIRSNRVKSELIVKKGLTEECFVTHNHSGGADRVIVRIIVPVQQEKEEETPPVIIGKEVEAADTVVAVIPPETCDTVPHDGQTEEEDAGVAPSAGIYLGVKTNIAAWAETIMNVAADVQVGRHFSVELPVLWCPWHVSGKHAVRTFAVQPEARYWLSEAGEGHFFGVHAHVGWFNVKWKRDRYQDTDRPLLGGGISYGYLLPFNARWAGEFTLGAGYANMRYDTFYNIDNGARIDTRTKEYWGVTRVGLSVVYRFNI